MNEGRVCSTEGCGRKHYATGFCRPHYDRHLRGSRTDTPIKTVRNQAPKSIRICGVVDCSRKHYARDCCNIHYQKFHMPHEYQLLMSAIERCHNPKNTAYKHYGAKGIEVSQVYRGKGGYNRFISEVGPRPSLKHSLDRIDGSKGYEPNNMRWATSTIQAINRGVFKNNSSGYTGVSRNAKSGNWIAFIKLDGVQTYLGSFKTLERALARRQHAEKLMHHQLLALAK